MYLHIPDFNRYIAIRILMFYDTVRYQLTYVYAHLWGTLLLRFSRALIRVHSTLEVISNNTSCNMPENSRILMSLTKIYATSTLQNN